MERSEFAEKYHKLTGLTYDVDALIANTPADKKGELYAKLSWNIKRGVVINVPENKELFTEIISDLAEKLDIDLSAEDVNGDNIIDGIDKIAQEDKSLVDIVTGSTPEPTTMPTTLEPTTVPTTEEYDGSIDSSYDD